LVKLIDKLHLIYLIDLIPIHLRFKNEQLTTLWGVWNECLTTLFGVGNEWCPYPRTIPWYSTNVIHTSASHMVYDNTRTGYGYIIIMFEYLNLIGIYSLLLYFIL
jgi:hypothetical protein